MYNMNRDEERLAERLEKQRREARATLDQPALYHAPHPVRCAADPAADSDWFLVSLCEARHKPAVLDMFRDGVATTGIYRRLVDLGDERIAGFNMLHGGSAEIFGGHGGGVSGCMMQRTRFVMTGAPIFTLSNELVQMLHRTKLNREVPLSELRLPCATLYLQLGTDRRASPLHLHNASSGMHLLEGAYVSRVRQLDGTDVLEFTLTGSPVDKTSLMDDAIEWISVYLDERRGLAEAIELAFTTPDRMFDDPRDWPAVRAAFADQDRLRGLAHEALEPLLLIAKALLFLSMPEALQRRDTSGTEARKALLRAQSGAHRRKAAKVAALSYDTTFIDLLQRTDDQLSPSGGRPNAIRHAGVAAHWRDGHLRAQRHGPGLSLTKVIWIRPVLVNADALASGDIVARGT